MIIGCGGAGKYHCEPFHHMGVAGAETPCHQHRQAAPLDMIQADRVLILTGKSLTRGLMPAIPMPGKRAALKWHALTPLVRSWRTPILPHSRHGGGDLGQGSALWSTDRSVIRCHPWPDGRVLSFQVEESQTDPAQKETLAFQTRLGHQARQQSAEKFVSNLLPLRRSLVMDRLTATVKCIP